MKKRAISIFILAAMLVFSAVSVGAESDAVTSETITRGEFFNALVAELGWTPSGEDIALPQDITADSPYAEAVSVLTAKGILAGYPDGTVKPEEELIPKHAAFLLGRVLGVSDADAEVFLQEEFGASSADLSAANLLSLASKVLNSDEQALELLHASAVAQNELNSYRMKMSQSMSMEGREDAGEAGMIAAMLSMDAESEAAFHHTDGMYIITKLSMPLLGLTDMTTEQYIVADGMFMSTENPETGETIWLKLPVNEGISFDEMLTLQESSLQLNAAFNDQFFFYRYKGVVEDEEGTYHHISFNGKIDSLQEMLEMASAVMPDQLGDLGLEATEFESMLGSLVLSGDMFIDEATGLAVKMNIDLSMTFDASVDPTMMPFKSISVSMDSLLYDLNEVDGITLPEEAQQAEDLQSMIDAELEAQLEAELEAELEEETEAELEEEADAELEAEE